MKASNSETSRIAGRSVNVVVEDAQRRAQALQAAFRDPSSPFYLAPGTKGPGSPEEYELPPDSTPESSNMQSDTSSFQQLVEQGRMKLVQAGFHHPTIWEQPIAWGHRLGGPDEAEALRKGKGISLIIKSLNVNYRRPVTYPDTVSTISVLFPSSYHLVMSVSPSLNTFSVTQQAFVAHCHETLVWYDYKKLRKSAPGEEYRTAVWEPYL
ncbi:hypothetical protein HHX47_DHR6000292 [Lentinula edodes]|nr:hypothetical protein HHX47_DHR6000292 [Lentinula edodes]